MRKKKQTRTWLVVSFLLLVRTAATYTVFVTMESSMRIQKRTIQTKLDN